MQYCIEHKDLSYILTDPLHAQLVQLTEKNSMRTLEKKAQSQLETSAMPNL